MIEPPSQPLAQALEELRLCRPADLRACRRRVKRLAHDLPAFDSVWIDALVQANKLTAFQADLLQSRDAQRLRVGPFVLEDQLGAASPESPTYLARHTSSSARCVLKIFDVAGQVADPGGEHLRSLAARGGSLQCPAVIVPHTCRVEGQQLVVVSRYVGVDLAELVVRRGRFQPVTVAAIGRQLIQGLLSLEQAGLVHGEVRLQKVRLTPRGQAVLVDGGIRQATDRGRLIHLGHKPEQCDGVAPELVGSGQDATVVSDVYALGCLLWQLLAGRPVFPRGDPLAKLAAHRTADVPDIREWAPDVPPQMAATLIQMTASDPDHRYQSFQEVQQQWGGCRSVDRRVLARSLNRLQQGPVHTATVAVGGGPVAGGFRSGCQPGGSRGHGGLAEHRPGLGQAALDSHRRTAGQCAGLACRVRRTAGVSACRSAAPTIRFAGGGRCVTPASTAAPDGRRSHTTGVGGGLSGGHRDRRHGADAPLFR